MPSQSQNPLILPTLIEHYRLDESWLRLICYYSDMFEIDVREERVRLVLTDLEVALREGWAEIVGLAVWFVGNLLADGGETRLSFRGLVQGLSISRLTLYAMNKSACLKTE
jgi:hypothetical protein